MINHKSSPRISVIMPVYNNAPYLKEGIECILNQTFTDFELIILNDGSTDGSDEIINSYARHDNRIVFINDAVNKGLVYRLNQGIKLAKGEFIARTDGDDTCITGRFEKQIKFLENNPEITICSAWYEFMGDRSGIVTLPLKHEEIKVLLIDYCTLAHALIMGRRSFFVDNNLEYDSMAISAEDYDLWTRIAEKATFANLPEVMLKYRMYSTQTSTQNAAFQTNNTDKCRMRMLSYIWEMNCDEDKRLANLIIHPSEITNINDAELVIKALDKLELRNLALKFYEEYQFKLYLRTKKKYIASTYYKNKSSYDLNVLIEFLKSSWEFKRLMSCKEKMKFFFKCVYGITKKS
jgi:glycosyltransferase involved in cell wall biosynthesis